MFLTFLLWLTICGAVIGKVPSVVFGAHVEYFLHMSYVSVGSIGLLVGLSVIHGTCRTGLFIVFNFWVS